MPYKNKADQKKHYVDNIESYKWRITFNTYGITKEDYFALLNKQDNKCALCTKSLAGVPRRESPIDHCHETGRIRGILCMQCNVGLGLLGDNEEGLLRALKYLRGEV